MSHDGKIPQLPPRRRIGPPPDPCAQTGHLSRPIRDADHRELGYLCLECGRIVHRRGDQELLELCALRYLDNGTTIGDVCRTRLERILRRARRTAGVEEESDA